MISRVLNYFPIVHSQSEMGSLGQAIMKVTQQKFGKRAWQDKVDLVSRFWCCIEDVVFKNLALPYSRTRVYQDGLPVCDKVEKIVEEIAGMGSQNHRLLLRLKENGATIMGTESAELLIEEYRLAKNILEVNDARKAVKIEAQQKAASERLLEQRDSFIAARIAQTLQAGETGVLFLGMLHNPVAGLPSDIQVCYPIAGLLDKGGPLDQEAGGC